MSNSALIMPDVFTKDKRSVIMSRVKGKGNKATKQKLIKLLHEHSITGWRRNYPLFGKPDFAFPRKRVAVFVDGEFWHGHPMGKPPKTNQHFWAEKIAKNKKRGRLVNRVLKEKGWIVVRIWQQKLKNSKRLQ
jgi:DNA mismatch endonuclease, patch repair protein